LEILYSFDCFNIIVHHFLIIISLTFSQIRIKQGQLLSSESIHKKLHTDKNYPILEEEKATYFEFIGIEKSPQVASSLLLFGLFNGSELMVDCSLFKYICKTSTHIESLILSLLFISFFPKEGGLLRSIYSIVASNPNLRMKHRFLLFQIERLKLIRQSSSSMEQVKKILCLNSITKLALSAISSFWTTNEQMKIIDKLVGFHLF
jgi:hypothetical protein